MSESYTTENIFCGNLEAIIDFHKKIKDTIEEKSKDKSSVLVSDVITAFYEPVKDLLRPITTLLDGVVTSVDDKVRTKDTDAGNPYGEFTVYTDSVCSLNILWDYIITCSSIYHSHNAIFLSFFRTDNNNGTVCTNSKELFLKRRYFAKIVHRIAGVFPLKYQTVYAETEYGLLKKINDILKNDGLRLKSFDFYDRMDLRKKSNEDIIIYEPDILHYESWLYDELKAAELNSRS